MIASLYLEQLNARLKYFDNLEQLNARLKYNDNPPKKYLDPAACSVPDISIPTQTLRDSSQELLRPEVPQSLPVIILDQLVDPELIPTDDSKPKLLCAKEQLSLPMIPQDHLVDSMKIIYDCFFEKLALDPPDQPVAVPVFHHSTKTVRSIQFPPFLPELPADLAVLNLAVSPDLGPPASNPIPSVTYAQMLVSKIRPPAADNPLCPKILATTPPVNCLAPGTHFLEPSSVPLFNASDHLHLSWSTMLAKGRRPLRSNRAPRPPEGPATIPHRARLCRTSRHL
jgi:hypothetical protein